MNDSRFEKLLLQPKDYTKLQGYNFNVSIRNARARGTNNSEQSINTLSHQSGIPKRHAQAACHTQQNQQPKTC